jgi:hypothetical protein
MTKFEDQLFDDLMREHGPALARAKVPAAPARNVTARRGVLAGGGALAVAVAVAGTLVATGGSAAYAVTKNPDGTITLDVYQQSGYAGANAELRKLGDKQVVVVPVGPGCPSLGSLPKPAVSAKGRMISVQSRVSADGSATVNAQGVPAGDIMVIGMEATGQGRVSASTLTSAPVPSCVSLPALPPGNSGSGSSSGASMSANGG